jgi:hypothetical protein
LKEIAPMQRTTLDKALRIGVALPTLVLLAFSSFMGVAWGATSGDEGVPRAEIFIWCLAPGVVGSLIMTWAGKRRFHYWILLFPVAGILSGLSWAYFPTYNDGVRLLVACFIFVVMYFSARWRSQIKE